MCVKLCIWFLEIIFITCTVSFSASWTVIFRQWKQCCSVAKCLSARSGRGGYDCGAIRGSGCGRRRRGVQSTLKVIMLPDSYDIFNVLISLLRNIRQRLMSRWRLSRKRRSSTAKHYSPPLPKWNCRKKLCDVCIHAFVCLVYLLWTMFLNIYIILSVRCGCSID